MSGERHPSRKSNSLSIVDDANAKNLHRPLRFGSEADIVLVSQLNGKMSAFGGEADMIRTRVNVR